MPRGRLNQTVEEAKIVSVRRIESALRNEPNGLRFGEIKRRSGLHQDTLTVRLRALMDEGKIIKTSKRYELSKPGTDDLDRLELLNLMAYPGFCVVKEGQSLDQAEASILQSSVAYAFPGITPGSLQGVMVVLSKYFMLHLFAYLIRLGLIDGKDLVENTPKLRHNLKTALREGLPRKQVLAFTIDYHKLAESLGEELIHELLRVARVEDSQHIESPTTQFIKSYTGKT